MMFISTGVFIPSTHNGNNLWDGDEATFVGVQRLPDRRLHLQSMCHDKST